MDRCCLRKVEDYRIKHFLEVDFVFPNSRIFEKMLTAARIDWRWHQNEGKDVYRFPRLLKRTDTILIDSALIGLDAESWSYGEYAIPKEERDLNE